MPDPQGASDREGGRRGAALRSGAGHTGAVRAFVTKGMGQTIILRVKSHQIATGNDDHFVFRSVRIHPRSDPVRVVGVASTLDGAV